MIETDSEGTLTGTFEYDGNKLMKITYTDGSKDVYTYANNKLSKRELYEGGVIVQTDTFEYDSNGKLKHFYSTDESNEVNHHNVYVYNANGTITVKEYTDETENNLFETYTLTLTNGNIVSYISENYSNTYTFDDKNAAEKNTFAIDVMNLAWHEGGVNNMLTLHFDNNGNNIQEITAVYTYNSNNYPVSCVNTFDGEVTTIQYIYE